MISENGSKGSQHNPEEAYIPKLIHECAKLPQSDRQVLPGWPHSRPLARPYNDIKSLKSISGTYTFCKMNKCTCSLRPKRPQSSPKTAPKCPNRPSYTQSNPKVTHKCPQRAAKFILLLHKSIKIHKETE